jgi:hypothetical protein
VTSGIKQQLASQLSDDKLKDYTFEKEKWTKYTFDSVTWREYEIAYKRLSKNRQFNISKACFNLWHTGRKNWRYYGGKKSCFMCNALEEDWIHILTCPSIDACMNREESWAKARKAMTHWNLPNDFWIAMGKGLNEYTRAPNRGDIATHFPPTYNNSRNHLKLAFREQDKIGWDKLIKGRMGRQWIEYVRQHIHNKNIKLKSSYWASKMTQDLWYHILRLWQYRNDTLHENDTKKVAQFKVEAMDRDIERLEVRIEDLRHKLRTFQDKHMQRVVHVKTLQHSSRKCWAALAKIYRDEAENRIETDIQLMDQYLQGRSVVE